MIKPKTCPSKKKNSGAAYVAACFLETAMVFKVYEENMFILCFSKWN